MIRDPDGVDASIAGPIRLVASGAGGGNDAAARLIARALALSMGQPVVVENHERKYAAASQVAKSRADGRTLLLYGSGLWLAPLIYRDVPYDALKDFSPAALIARSPNALLVHESVGARSVEELLDMMRQQPARFECGYSVPGGSPHLAAELFRDMTACPMKLRAYDGVAALYADLRSGKLQMSFPNASGAKQLLKAGSLKLLAVTSAVPSVLFPRAATVAATVAGYVSEAIFAMFMPGGASNATITELGQYVARSMAPPDIRSEFLDIGLEVVAGDGEALTRTMRRDLERMRSVSMRIRAQLENVA